MKKLLIYSIKTEFAFYLGIKLRRQHWCLLLSVVVALVILMGVFVPISKSGLSQISPAAQKKAIIDLLSEVPLIDG